MLSVLQLPCPGNDTWEYKVFVSNSAEIVDMLANVRLAGRVADKLSAAGIIGKSVTELAHNYGIGITETSRVRHIITVLKDMIQLNPRRYHEFRDILLSLGADTETALHYMPKTGKVICDQLVCVFVERIILRKYFNTAGTCIHHRSNNT